MLIVGFVLFGMFGESSEHQKEDCVKNKVNN